MEWWGWLLAGAGALTTLWKAAEVIIDVTQPFRDHAKRLEELERQRVEADEVFKDIEAQLGAVQNMNRALCKSVLHMVNHMIDGNSVQKMKEARDELEMYIVEH